MNSDRPPVPNLEFFISPEENASLSERAPGLCLGAGAEISCSPLGVQLMYMIGDKLSPEEDIGDDMAEQRLRCRLCLAEAVMRFTTMPLGWVEEIGFTRGIIGFPEGCPLSRQPITDGL